MNSWLCTCPLSPIHRINEHYLGLSGKGALKIQKVWWATKHKSFYKVYFGTIPTVVSVGEVRIIFATTLSSPQWTLEWCFDKRANHRTIRIFRTLSMRPTSTNGIRWTWRKQNSFHWQISNERSLRILNETAPFCIGNWTKNSCPQNVYTRYGA